MANANIKKKLNDIIGWVDTFQTLLNQRNLSALSEYGLNNSLANWLANGGKLTQSIDILQLLYIIIGDRDWETAVFEWLQELFNDPTWFTTIEESIKISVLGILYDLLSCDINPIIPDKLIMSSDTDSASKTDRERKLINGAGYTIPLSVIDMIGSLYLSPANKYGKYQYFDIREEPKEINEYNNSVISSYITSRLKLTAVDKKDESQGYEFQWKTIGKYGTRDWGVKDDAYPDENNPNTDLYDKLYFFKKSDRNTWYQIKKLEKRIGISSEEFEASKVITILSILDDEGKYRSLDKYGESGRTSSIFINNENLDLQLQILNQYGVFICDVPDTLWQIQSSVDVNNLWRSLDFNAFLWYVINRGNPANSIEKYKCVWDNRYNWKNTDTSLHRIATLGEDFYDAQTEGDVIDYNDEDADKYQEVKVQIKVQEETDDGALIGEDEGTRNGETFGYNESGYTVFKEQIDDAIKALPEGEKYLMVRVVGILPDGTEETESKDIRKYKVCNKEWLGWKDIAVSGNQTTKGDEGTGTEKYKLPRNLKRIKQINFSRKLSEKNPKRKKKQIAYFEYSEGNSLLEGSIKVWIRPYEYYRVHGINIPKFISVKVNQYMLAWDYDFIHSIKLFDGKVFLAKLMDLVFNGAKPTISMNYSQLVLNEMVKNVVDGIIAMDDTNVNDCYYTFTNDQFNTMLHNADRVRRGFATDGYSYNASDIYNDDTIQGLMTGDVTTIANTMNNITSNRSGGTQNGGLQVQSIWKSWLNYATYCIAELFFSPKVMMVIAINMEFLGMDINKTQSWDNILTLMAKAVSDTIVKMKDMLISKILSWITDELTRLMEKVITYLAMEQLKTYKDILENLLLLVKKFFAMGNAIGSGSSPQEVAYADIQKPESSQTGEVSTDANNNGC